MCCNISHKYIVNTFQENPARVVLEYDAASVYKVTEALASFGAVRVEKEASGAQHHPPGVPQVSHVPVSYTHLTLPTKLSV